MSPEWHGYWDRTSSGSVYRTVVLVSGLSEIIAFGNAVYYYITWIVGKGGGLFVSHKTMLTNLGRQYTAHFFIIHVNSCTV